MHTVAHTVEATGSMSRRAEEGALTGWEKGIG
jgi:hypothetical protein